MALHGSIGEFDPSKEDWKTYVSRLKFYFIANDVEDPRKQKAILLSVAGPELYKLASSLVSPLQPHQVDLDELVQQLNKHYDPKKSISVHRFKFNSRVRKPGESVSTYIAELKKLASLCDFDGEVWLPQMLRDRLVCGIGDSRMQRRLLAEEDLTFDKALQLVQAMESADQSASALTPDSGKADVNQVTYRKYRGGKPKQVDTPTRSKPPDGQCYRCAGEHSADNCRFKNVDCRYCGKRGHIARACRMRLQRKQQPRKSQPEPTHHVSNTTPEESNELPPDYAMFQLSVGRSDPIRVTVTANDRSLPMELDTGAALSVISHSTYLSTWSEEERPVLEPSHVQLSTYSGEVLTIRGAIDVQVKYQSQQCQLSLQVVDTSGPTLLGRDWLKHLVLDWHQISTLENFATKKLSKILEDYADVFKNELGSIRDVKVHIHVKKDAQPHYVRPRPVPYAFREKVDTELKRLQDAGVIEPVPFADWAAPVVPVLKRDNSIRLCGDYKLTVNQEATPDIYPLPGVEGILATMAEGEWYSKLDLAHAYNQLHLDDESKKYTTINTTQGLFQYNRLPFGISCAPAVFQRTMENLLKGIPGVCVYLDDILITGKSASEHLENLETVLNRLQSSGMRLKKEKCQFMLQEVDYLGHKLSREGLKPSSEKIKALKEAPTPKDVTQLKSFLGLVNYYSRFLPNLSTILAPLYALLHKVTAWHWGPEQQKAFEFVKNALTSDSVLSHYSIHKELLLSCDASPYGLGAVLSHKMDDGTEKPIAFASRSLSTAERKYAQLDKEALAIIFGVTKFRQYLLGRRFVIHSDHKPLMYIFGENRGVPSMASSRIQRWALTLGAYSFSVTHRPGKENSNADGLSRLPLPDLPTNVPPPQDTVLLLESIQTSLVTAAQIKKWTARDPILSKVLNYVLQGWPSKPDSDELRPFFHRKEELSIEDGCILWGHRVVIPPPGREKIVELLHESHPGMTRIKGIARSYVWWPGIDDVLEKKVRHCQSCQEHQRLPSKAPLHPWEFPERPWSRLHIDFAGPFLNKQFLLVVDAHSKWIEVFIVPTTSSQAAINKLRPLFATHGLPELLVSDNGAAFTSDEFSVFTKKNGIRHTTSAPYHPSTNGLVERAVQTFKQAMRKSNEPLDIRMAKFLFTYRLTPHPATGVAPSELLLSRRPRSLLDLVKPDVSSKVRLHQERQKLSHDQKVRSRRFDKGDEVLAKNFGRGEKWLKGRVVQCRGPLSYRVFLEDGRSVRRHQDHLQPFHTPIVDDLVVPSVKAEADSPAISPTPVSPAPASPPPVSPSPPAPAALDSNPAVPDERQSPIIPRRSNRSRRPPDWFCLEGRNM